MTTPMALAFNRDGAVRCVDGRWSEGFVDTDELAQLVKDGVLKLEKRQGMLFAVRAVTAKDLQRQVRDYLRKRGAMRASVTGFNDWDLAVDTVFRTPLLVRVTNTDGYPAYIQMRFLKADIKVTREIEDINSFNPVTGRWDIVSGDWGQTPCTRPFSHEDAPVVYAALFETFKRRMQDVLFHKKPIIRDR